MPNIRANSGVPETVLAGRGTSARFDGSRLLIVRGRTTWTAPVEALASAELIAGHTVRIDISGEGDAAGAAQGLGRTVELRAPNAQAAQAFHGQVSAAMARTRRAADGLALVRVDRGAGRSFRLSPGARRAAVISAGVTVYAVLLAVLGVAGPLGAGLAVASLAPGGVAGLAGGGILWRVGRRVRSLWLLRRRGIGVVGKVTGHVKIWSKGGHLWVFSTMTFTTVKKRRMPDVPSVVTIWGFKEGALSGQPVELIYDPEHPTRASRPPTVGFAVRTLVLALPGVLLVAGWAICVLINLPG